MHAEAVFTRCTYNRDPSSGKNTTLDYPTLFRRTRPTLNFLTRLILQDEKNAQAVTQLCLKRASSLVTTFQNEGELCCWLLRAVIDEALVHRQKHQSRLMLLGKTA